VPIFWRNRPGEEDAVVGEGERIKRLLAQAKLDVWVDRTHKKSPGQKLAFWEAVGVGWRIELGPDDVRGKRCVVSKAGSDGFASAVKVRDVSSVRRGDVLRALRDRLGLAKVPALDEDPALDAEHDKEADAALRKWREAARGEEAPRLAATRPKVSLGKKRINVDAKSSSKKITFGGDDDDDDIYAAAGADDDSSGEES